MDHEQGALVDHHCHGVVLDDLDRLEFEAMMNEARHPSPLGTTAFDSMLGLALRRWCAPVLGLPERASAEDYLARRRELGAGEASRRLLRASGISTFLVDTGLADDRLTPPAELASAAGGTAHEVVRLERVVEDLLAAQVPVADVPDHVEQRLRGTQAVATKSIAAYRTGLDLPGTKPSRESVVAALRDVRVLGHGRHRVAHPIVHGWLAWSAIELGKPLQVHVGYGDGDLDLRASNPLRLTAFLRATEERMVPVALLHNYPYHRAAAYLAQVFDHVFVDVGLAVHGAGALSDQLLREALELVPFGKLLFSSDGYGLAELHLLGAQLYRRGMRRVLDTLVEDGEMTDADAAYATALVEHENARRIYPLG